MTAFESMQFEDLRQRKANGEELTPTEAKRLAQLERLDRDEWDREEPPRWLGGDYPDL